MAAALQEADAATPADPKAAARAEAQRQRLKAEREATVLAGLDDLDRWVVDQINLGLAGFAQRAGQSTRTPPCYIDPVSLVRGGGRDGGLLDQYVSDRPYAASSFLSRRCPTGGQAPT